MAQCDGKGIGGIEVLRLDIDVQGLPYHNFDLFLGRCTVAADGYLGLSRGIFRDWDSSLRGGDDGCTLGTAELEDDLGVLPVERGLDGQVGRGILRDEFLHAGIDVRQLLEGIGDLPEVEDSHRDIVRALLINGNDPETKDVGSGIDS